MRRSQVAVIGGGVSGLTAGYLLQRRHDVTLFEADDRLGGHAHTHALTTSDGRTVGVDSGFIVRNDRTCPHLLRLFAEPAVSTRSTEMSMSVSCEGCGLEYAGEWVRSDRVLARMTYRHPVHTAASVAARRRLGELDDERVCFAGACHGWGFPEDGCLAGVRAAEALGARW